MTIFKYFTVKLKIIITNNFHKTYIEHNAIYYNINIGDSCRN